MRIFLPLTEIAAHDAGAHRLDLAEGTLVWGCTAEAVREVGGDTEDLEYEALQDAVHVAFQAGDGRAVVLAGDVPDRDLGDGPEESGLYGLRICRPTVMQLASRHVSELTRAEAEASDTDPALLWFDVSEGARALEVAEHGPGMLEAQ